MKNLVFLCMLFPGLVFAQQTTHTFSFDGQTRQYIKYVPSSYTGSEAVPVVFSLHGLGDNMSNFSQVGFHQVADTANIIIITPEALPETILTGGANAWNSGAGSFGLSLNGNINDIGFLGAILDTIIANYNVDETRVYSCGFSLGGFMSQRIACELNTRFTAVASVAGTIGGELTCSPGASVPVCHFHGTADATIAYSGNIYGSDPEDLVDFWATNNGCTATPTTTALPDNASDGYTVTHYEYGSCTDEAGVEFFKVTGADHVWLFTPVNDISYTEEIWKFFLKYPTAPDTSISTSANITTKPTINIHPNPASGSISITGITGVKYIFNGAGKLLLTTNENTLNVSTYPTGLYFLQIRDSNGKLFTRKWVKE